MAGVLTIAAAAHAGVLVADDFNDNALDTSKWWVNTSGIPQSGARVEEINQHIELTGRGHLATVDEVDPTQGPVGLRITGEWTFVSGDDFFQVLTRSDAQPAGNWGETANGIEFQAMAHNESFTIRSRGPAGVSSVAVDKSAAFNIAGGDTFAFTITDFGDDLSFLLTHVNEPDNWAAATAYSTTSRDDNYIVFHNREAGRRSNLDNVRIDLVPEPATVGLLGLATVTLLRRRRR
ncbi:MAG: PEP-CTERM sorting domain-containing protein [Planctomycetota bacterium]